jgi:hypothetical protein
MTAFLVWFRRFDMKPEPQIIFDFIPASMKPDIAAQHPLSDDDARLPLDHLAAKFPAPEIRL